MNSAVFTNQYRVTADLLLETTFITNGLCAQERQNKLEKTGFQLGQLLLEGEGDTPLVSSYAIHGAAMLACLPSLKQTATGRKHTIDVAQQVSSNLQDLSSEISRKKIATNPEDDILGILGETSVLAAIWWGIGNGYFHEDSYAVLTTVKKDVGTSIGMRNGFDISFKQGGDNSRKHKIQVKTRHSPRQDNSYDPKIKVITPSDLTPVKGREFPTRTLIQALADGNIATLDAAANRARRILSL
jgi:hypothetical protein